LIEPNPFSKRIKRQVIGRRHTFFIATTPGLNKICRDELAALSLPISDVTAVSGGVEFSGRLTDCYSANLHLRTANRILMRLFEVKATNFRQLTKRMADFHWELYLKPRIPVKFSISTARCRLYHQDAIRDSILSGISRRLDAMGQNDDPAEKQHPAQGIFIRGSDDRFVLSLDSSGDLLYKRGIKLHGGHAPIRETLAAAALRLAGYSARKPLIDPLCGSGTFSLEGGMVAAHIPPGGYREFAFKDWPAFKPRQWEYINNHSERQFQFRETPMIFASDIEANTVKTLEETVRSVGLSENIQVSCRDFFDFHPSEITGHADGIVAINPPYGIRLMTDKGGGRLFKTIVQKLTRDYKNWKCILVVPDKHWIKGLAFHHAVYPVLHGGRKAYIIVGKI